MTRSLGIVITLAVCALFLAAGLANFEVPLLDQLELKTYDMRMRALERSPARHVTIAAIDEQSLAKVGRWPWSRSVHAGIIRRLDEAGARVIAFDIFFPSASRRRLTRSLRACSAHSKKTVLQHGLPDRTSAKRAISANPAPQAGLKAIAPQAIAEGGGREPLQKAFGVLANIPELQASARYSGHINVLSDADGIYRRVPLVMLHGDRYFPSFDVQVARAFYAGQGIRAEARRLRRGQHEDRGTRISARHAGTAPGALSRQGRDDVRHAFRSPTSSTARPIPRCCATGWC